MEGPYDGKKLKYVFGHGHKTWDVETTSLAKAIRAFRVGAMFPHQYSSAPLASKYGDGWDDKVYMSSQPGATVLVRVILNREWVEVTNISPDEDVDDEYSSALLSAQQTLQIASEAMGFQAEEGSTALTHAGTQTGLATTNRRLLEEKTFELEKRMAELEAAKHALKMQVAEMQAELRRRMEQVWMIELFLGSNEEVKLLREGNPAPANTPITVRQQVLCMDEEIAVFDWFENPDRIGEFDYSHLDDFDQWLLDDPAHLHAIFPHPKGIVGLRVRRKRKERGEAQGYVGISGAFQAMDEQRWDEMTYLLVRNGDNLYRLWVDVNMWPRLFSAAKDFRPKVDKWADGREHIASRMNQRDFEEKQKKFFAGMLVIQGLIERSDLLHPLPIPNLSVARPEHQEHFNLVRDGEEFLMLGDSEHEFGHLTWRNYVGWLRQQLEPGVRVLYMGPQWFNSSDRYDNWESRTGMKSVHKAPSHHIIHTLVEPADGWRAPSRGKYQLLYLPDDNVYAGGSWWQDGTYQKRQKRVRWGCYADEILPVDFISWRVLEYMLKDRNSREDYGEFFVPAFRWWKQKKAEAEREGPFVNLVLVQAGADPTEENRARVERLVRWWKLKTQTHRTLGDDEAKALRMIVKAFTRGDDHDNDPERLLFQR